MNFLSSSIIVNNRLSNLAQLLFLMPLEKLFPLQFKSFASSVHKRVLQLFNSMKYLCYSPIQKSSSEKRTVESFLFGLCVMLRLELKWLLEDHSNFLTIFHLPLQEEAKFAISSVWEPPCLTCFKKETINSIKRSENCSHKEICPETRRGEEHSLWLSAEQPSFQRRGRRAGT
jgi:hypothetical protein